MPRPPRSPLFPYTTLFRSRGERGIGALMGEREHFIPVGRAAFLAGLPLLQHGADLRDVPTQHLVATRPDFVDERQLRGDVRSEEHTSELQSPDHLVCRLLL